MDGDGPLAQRDFGACQRGVSRDAEVALIVGASVGYGPVAGLARAATVALPAAASVPVPSLPISRHIEHLHHLVAKVINDLHRNPSGFRLVKWTGGRLPKRGPSILVNLCLQRSLKCSVGILPTEEVGLSHEETLLVVVRIDKPARYVPQVRCF